MSKSKTYYLPSLDGLRALSFGIVFAAHAGLNRYIPGPFGVTVFFFLSGYLITTLMRTEVQDTGHISLKQFYLRRALRILPPFYIVLLLSMLTIWTGLHREPVDMGSVWALLLHYANYYIVQHNHLGFPPGTGVYWSLAVEEHFYLLFPFIYLSLQRRSWTPRQQALALLVVCALIAAWRCVLVFGFDASLHRTSVASDTRFDSMLFGCALAIYENPALDSSHLSERMWKWVLLPLGLVGLLVCFAVRNDAFRETVRYSIQGLSLIPVFVCAIRYPEWLPMRALNWKPLAFVGTLSYSLYLIHLLVYSMVLQHLEASIGLVAVGFLTLGVSFVISLLLWQFVEKPCARLRRRLHA